MIEGSENGPQEKVAATDRPELDNGTDQENPKEAPSNKEGHDTPKDSASSTKILPIKLDILKSIVYGGLIESITSFGVVSSAAATGTSTLNVLSLGLANLFTGFFIIIHNLHGLFKRPRYQRLNDDDMPQETIDPYKERLGERHRVILHCFVVLVSFIFFAVIPPLFYGFSFKITDRGCYQEAAIFIAASLACVISLSFSKVYAFGMDKLTTVAVYTGITICGSSLSYIASQYAVGVFATYDFHKLAAGYLER
ncbi:membrane protein of ER body 1-like [Raphanus sativus]|uniref:Membrane protein of ER body 1-like n=1 Tax=Raphanus sativus TaxID=3726 RepID=A0A9W3CMU9_RAPSA|nr:membrane protein of ER body 1-like [Raphanus sativus]